MRPAFVSDRIFHGIEKKRLGGAVYLLFHHQDFDSSPSGGSPVSTFTANRQFRGVLASMNLCRIVAIFQPCGPIWLQSLLCSAAY